MAKKRTTKAAAKAPAVVPAEATVRSASGRTRLFATADRDVSHKKLEAILKAGEHPSAECREDPNDPDGLCYAVWDGPEKPFELPPEPPSRALAAEDALVDKIVAKLAARLGVK